MKLQIHIKTNSLQSTFNQLTGLALLAVGLQHELGMQGQHPLPQGLAGKIHESLQLLPRWVRGGPDAYV